MADIVARAVLVDKMSAKLKDIQNNYKKTSDSIKKGSKDMASGAKGMTSSFMSMKGALAGLAVGGIGVFVKSMVQAQAEMEGLETKFKVLLGDTESAKARMQELSKFAQTTPFQLTEVANASRVLQTLGGTALATGDSLRLVGDASAISGESFENLAVHVGRAYSGLQANRPIGESMARLQELGLVSGETRNKIEDLTKEAKGKEAWKVLQKELQKTKGGMKELSGTFAGLTSTLRDQFQAVLRQLAQGTFDSLKTDLKGVVDTMNSLLDSGFFTRLGAGIGLFTQGVNATINGLQGLFSMTRISLNEMASTAIDAIRSIVTAMPSKLVPDSWVKSLDNAQMGLAVSSAQIKVQLQEDADEGAEIMERMVDSFNTLWNGPKGKKFVESATNAGKKAIEGATTGDDDALAQALEERRIKIRDAYDEVLLGLMSDADREREILYQKQQERIQLLGMTDEVLLLNKKETAALEAKIQKDADDAKAESEQHYTQILEQEAEKRKSIRMAELNLAMTLTSSLSTIAQNALGSSKKNAKARKGIALSEAIVNTGLGVTRALSSAPPPINFINAAAVGASGAAQISTIASQKFAQGGIVKGNGTSDLGDKTLIRVNAGEGVFTKDQMKALGEQRQPMTIAPNITINGNADQGTIQKLDDSLQAFADKIIEAERGGFLNFSNDFNLVTQ